MKWAEFFGFGNILAVIIIPIILNILFSIVSQRSNKKQLDDLQNALTQLHAETLEARAEIVIRQVKNSEKLIVEIGDGLAKVEAIAPELDYREFRRRVFLRTLRYYAAFVVVIASFMMVAVSQEGFEFLAFLALIVSLFLVANIFEFGSVLSDIRSRVRQKIVVRERKGFVANLEALDLERDDILPLIPEIRQREFLIGADYIAERLDEFRRSKARSS